MFPKFIFISFLIFLTYISKIKFEKLLNPTSIILLWWGGWTFLSMFSTTNLFFPSSAAIFNVMIFLIALICGSLFAPLNLQSTTSSYAIQAKNERGFFYFLRYYSIFFMFPLVLISIYLAIKSLMLLNNGITGSGLRTHFYTITESGNYWFPSKIAWSLFLIGSGVLFHSLLIISSTILLHKKKYYYFIILLLLTFLEAMTRMSRGPIYAILLTIIIPVVSIESLRTKLLRSKNFFIPFGIGMTFSFLVIFIISSFRLGGKGILTVVEKAIIDQHTCGIVLLSRLVEKASPVFSGELTLGRMTFGGLENLFTMVVRKFIPNYNSPAYQNMFNTSQSIMTGIHTNPSMPKKHNAFYTMLSSTYIDFREFGQIILGLIIGYWLTKFYFIYLKNKCVMSLAWIIFILHNVFFGLFGNTFETQGFWLTLILMICLNIFIKMNFGSNAHAK